MSVKKHTKASALHCEFRRKRQCIGGDVKATKERLSSLGAKPMNGSVREMISFLYERNIPGRSIDLSICASNVAEYADRPLLLIRLDSLDEMLHMCRGADHVLCVPTRDNTVGGALYSDISRFPIARFYHLRLGPDLLSAGRLFGVLKKSNFNVEAPHPETMSRLVREDGWKARLEEHLKVRSARIADYEKLRSGRARNTTTDSSLFLNSSGCLICGAPPDFIASTTFGGIGEPALLTAVRLCSTHMAEAREEASLLNYLAKAFDIPFLMNSLGRTPEEVLSDGASIMQSNLGMMVFDQGKTVVKARTAKGTVLIYRYEGEFNYGYMIDGGNGEKLARIDSANHHRVEVGPDHLHPDLQNKVPATSSFTTGDLCLDWPLMRELIDHWDKKIR